VFGDLWPGKAVRRWQKGIRRLARTLGDARDRDVQIEFLRQTLGEVAEPSQRLGVSRLLLRSLQQRERVQPNVLAAAKRATSSSWLAKIRRAVAKGALPSSAAAKRPSRALLKRARKYVLAAAEELTSHQDSLAEPQQIARHHEMRIAAKRLRYTMEVFRPAYDGELDGQIDSVKDVQTLLGEVHDCDLWIERLANFLRAEWERTVTYCGDDEPMVEIQPGIEFLRQRLQRKRDETFTQLSLYWDQLRDREFWSELAQTLQRHLDAGDVPEISPAEVIRPSTPQDVAP
jgi:CHAD domain-containing protein